MMKEFFHQFKGEFKKIIWPNRETLTKQTTVVIVTSLVVAAVVFAMDVVYSRGFDLIMKIFE